MPPRGVSRETASDAAARVPWSACTMPLGGYTGSASPTPAITANHVPSAISLIAAAAALRAATILACGAPIDPEQSMMIASAAPPTSPA